MGGVEECVGLEDSGSEDASRGCSVRTDSREGPWTMRPQEIELSFHPNDAVEDSSPVRRGA